MEINPKSQLPFYHPDYQPPTFEALRVVMKSQGWTGAKVAALVGVDSRTVRRWTGNERPVPYSAWRLLLIYAGLDHDA